MSRSRSIRVSVSSRAEIRTSWSRGNVGRSWSRSRLGLKTKCLGLVSVSDLKVSFTTLPLILQISISTLGLLFCFPTKSLPPYNPIQSPFPGKTELIHVLNHTSSPILPETSLLQPPYFYRSTHNVTFKMPKPSQSATSLHRWLLTILTQHYHVHNQRHSTPHIHLQWRQLRGTGRGHCPPKISKMIYFLKFY